MHEVIGLLVNAAPTTGPPLRAIALVALGAYALGVWLVLRG